MTAIPAFYGFPHHTLQAVEVTIARVQVWDDAQKCARMAKRAREYEQKYGTREGNYGA